MKQLVWLSYDLGVTGDYPNLYAFLDMREAKECGSSVAAFEYNYELNIVEELKNELINSIKLKPTDRLYLIFKDRDGQLKGKFIWGRRRRSPWEGYHDGWTKEGIEDVLNEIAK